MRMSGGAAIQQVLETSVNAEFGLISMLEWAREPGELRSAVSYLRWVEKSGQKVRMSNSGSCEEHDESTFGQV